MSNLAASAASSLKTTLVLRNVPRTALASDVRRLLEKNNIENVQNVYLDYQRFLAMGKAFVTFTHPAYVQPAILRLRTAQLSGMPLDVVATGPLETRPGRSRGVQGRTEAMNRGVLDGNGPDAGVTERGKNVIVWGLPGKLTTDQLREYLKSCRLGDTRGGKEEILKIEPEGRPTLTSRHYVRTVSASEAHRLVRRLHVSSFDQKGRLYMIRARVVY